MSQNDLLTVNIDVNVNRINHLRSGYSSVTGTNVDVDYDWNLAKSVARSLFLYDGPIEPISELTDEPIKPTIHQLNQKRFYDLIIIEKEFFKSREYQKMFCEYLQKHVVDIVENSEECKQAEETCRKAKDEEIRAKNVCDILEKLMSDLTEPECDECSECPECIVNNKLVIDAASQLDPVNREMLLNIIKKPIK